MFEKEKLEVIKTGMKLDRSGLIALAGGTVSLRMPTGEILVTPSGMIYEEMVADDVVVMDIDGNIIENRILGEKLGISDFRVLVAILVFGGIFGFAGMLLGVPVFAVLYTVIGDRVNKRLARKRHPQQTSLYYTIRTVDDLPPVTEPSYTSAAEEPAYETQIDPDDDMEIDDPDYDDIPG